MTAAAVVHPVLLDPDYPALKQHIIELTGLGAGVGANGLTITGGGTTVRGFIINRFSQDGINVSGGSGNTIAGNYIGTNAGGTVDQGGPAELGRLVEMDRKLLQCRQSRQPAPEVRVREIELHREFAERRKVAEGSAVCHDGSGN